MALTFKTPTEPESQLPQSPEDMAAQYGVSLSYRRRTKVDAPEAPAQPTQFMQDFYTQMQALGEGEQGVFVSNIMQSLSDRLAKYNYRMARGGELSPEQQQEYQALVKSLEEVQDYAHQRPESIETLPDRQEQYRQEQLAHLHSGGFKFEPIRECSGLFGTIFEGK
jgi:hypothetical protein